MKSIADILREILSDGNEYSPYELQEILKCEHQRFHSDGTITRKLRELRQKGCEIMWRYSHKGSRNTYYWMVK